MRISDWIQTCALPILLVLARRDPDFGVNNVCLAAKGNEKIIAVHRPGVRRVSVDGHGQRMEAIAIEAERFEMLVASLDRETCLHARTRRIEVDVERDPPHAPERRRIIGTMDRSVGRAGSVRRHLLAPDYRSEEHTYEIQSLMRISYA